MVKSIKKIFLGCTIIILMSNMQTTSLFYGDFKCIKMLTYVSDSLQSTFYNPMVKLYPSEVNEKMPFKASKIGNVSYNHVLLKYNELMKMYVDSIERKTESNSVWTVSNSTVIANTTFTISIAYPAFNNIKNIPDTIRKNGIYVINLLGMANTDFVEFVLDDGIMHAAVPWYRKIPSSINNIAINGQNFLSINNGVAKVRLVFTKRQTITINSKNYLFEKRLMIVKPVAIIN